MNKYCVIGGAGFLGSHLVDFLIEQGHSVLVLDNLIAGQKKFVNPKAEFMWCDITHSEEQLRKIFQKYEIEYVFNYSAEPYIPVSFQRPLHVTDINARGALMILNAAQEAGVKRILQVSSAEIYGDAPEHKIDETHPPHPHSTYGAAKLFIDNLIQCRWLEAKTPAIALRQFNCYGPRETHPYVIPEIIGQIGAQIKQVCSDCGKAILKDESARSYEEDGPIWHVAHEVCPTDPVKIKVKLGNNSFRDFQYAKDAVRMAFDLLHAGEPGQVYNMGSEDGIKMYDLAILVGKLMGCEVEVETDPARVRPWEIWHLQSDNTKLYNAIPARPEVNFENGLKDTIAHYMKNGKKWDYEN